MQAFQKPRLLIVTGRSLSKLQISIDALKKDSPDVEYRPWVVDLSSQKSVRASAAELLSWSDVPEVDLMVNSAGVMGIQERTLTEDGIEAHFATNHIGHWLLTNLILPKLVTAAQGKPKGTVRVVNVSSRSPTVSVMRWSDMNFDKVNRELSEAEQPPYAFIKGWGYKDPENMSYIPIEGYSQSKVANVLFGIGATRRWYERHGILVLALHPGIISTELGRNFPQETLDSIKGMADSGVFTYKTLGAGASTSLVAALDPKLGPGETRDGKENYGAFLDNCQISVEARDQAVSSAEAEKLWKVSEELVKQKFE